MSAPADPHFLGAYLSRLGGGSRRAGRAAALVAASILEDGERCEAVVQGRYLGDAGVAVLTDRRVLLINDHEWKPVVKELPVAPGLAVQGWVDDRAASLMFTVGGEQFLVDEIRDRDIAQQFAAAVRGRIA